MPAVQGQVVTAPMGEIRVGSVTLGYATGLSATVDIPHTQIKTVGRLPAREIVPVDLNVSGSIGQFFLFELSPMDMGVFPRGTTAAILAQGYVDIIFQDDAGSQIVAYYRCKMTQNGQAVQVGSGAMSANLQFVGTTYTDSATLEIS